MSLTVQVNPGALPPDGQIITNAILRQLAQPTVNISGSLGTALIPDNSVTTQKLVDGILSANAAGRAKVANSFITLVMINAGIFTADAGGRAPFANGWLSLALVGNGIFTATTAGRAPFAAGAITAAQMQPDAYSYGVASGSASAYVVAFTPALNTYASPAISAYWDGLEVAFKAPATCAAAVTLNVDSIGIKGIYRLDGTALKAGDIQNTQLCVVRYNSSLNSNSGGWNLITTPMGLAVAPSSQLAFTGGAAQYLYNHALGSIPQWIRWVAVCQTAENGYSIGDEVDAIALLDGNSGARGSASSDANNAYFTMHSSGSTFLNNKSTGVLTALAGGSGTITNWKLKCYVRPS